MSSSLRSADRRKIETANQAYHEKEAGLYDQSHPEILWCERTHWQAFAKNILPLLPTDLRLIDVGAGTGFIGSVLGPFLGAEATYVATDLSPGMLDILHKNLDHVRCKQERHVCSAERIPLPDQRADAVVFNSVLHHFPDPHAALREAVRLLKPHGFLAIMHEPNVRFARSFFLQQTARAAARIAARFDRSAQPHVRPDYAPVFAHVNQVLLEQKLICAPLAQADIQALVDVHSPTARGRSEEIGFDVQDWLETIFSGWRVETFETYNFLGKLDPQAFFWRRCLDRALAQMLPKRGALLSCIVQKP